MTKNLRINNSANIIHISIYTSIVYEFIFKWLMRCPSQTSTRVFKIKTAPKNEAF